MAEQTSEKTSEKTTEQQDKRARLDELKIDRSSTVEGSGIAWFKWVLSLLVVLGIGGGLWFLLANQADVGVPVTISVARATSATPAGTSVLDATGYVVARRQATVSSKTTGKVVEVMIEEGVFVAQGQLLASLDDSIPRAQYELAQSQFEAAQAGLKELEVALKQGQLDLDRTQGLAERKLASQADLDRDGLSVEALVARLARANKDTQVAQRSLAVQAQLLEDMQIRAPFNGIVIAKAAQPGEMISPISAGGGFTRTGICTIVDMDSLEVEVDVNEAYLNRVHAKQPVEVTLNAYADRHFPAEVIAIIPTADRNKATVRVRVGLLEKDDRVLPDMGVRVAFLDETADSEPVAAPTGVLIDTTAISSNGSDSHVLVVRNNRIGKRKVTLGGVEGERTRILSGLANGEKVVAQLTPETEAILAEGTEVSVRVNMPK